MIPTSMDWIQLQFVHEFGYKPHLADFYYNDNGLRVSTKAYHIRRGYCCGKGCKHCLYTPIHVLDKKL